MITGMRPGLTVYHVYSPRDFAKAAISSGHSRVDLPTVLSHNDCVRHTQLARRYSPAGLLAARNAVSVCNISSRTASVSGVWSLPFSSW